MIQRGLLSERKKNRVPIKVKHQNCPVSKCQPFPYKPWFLTKDTSVSTSLPPGSSSGGPSYSSSIGYGGGYGGSGGGSQSTSPGWKVTFPDIEIHSPKDIQPDKASISSRGTSSTVGYRYAFSFLIHAYQNLSTSSVHRPAQTFGLLASFVP